MQKNSHITVYKKLYYSVLVKTGRKNFKLGKTKSGSRRTGRKNGSRVFTKKVFLNFIFKGFKKQRRRSSLMSAFTFDLIFIYYLHSVYIIKGHFLQFCWGHNNLYFELFRTLLQPDKFVVLYEVLLSVESHETPLNIGRKDESSAVNFDFFVFSLSSH